MTLKQEMSEMITIRLCRRREGGKRMTRDVESVDRDGGRFVSKYFRPIQSNFCDGITQFDHRFGFVESVEGGEKSVRRTMITTHKELNDGMTIVK